MESVQAREQIGQAQAAADRRDWPEALALAAALRRQFPDAAAGYRIGGIAARGLRRFAESRDILLAALAMFPAEAWPATELIWTAKAAGDRREQIRLIGILLDRFGNRPAGYQFGFVLALEMQRLVEAAHFAAEAQKRFPDQAWPLVNTALLAHESGDTETARTIAAGLRERFPEDPAGYEIGAVAARALRRTDEATALLDAAMARYPDRPTALIEAAYTERFKGNFDTALRHAATLRKKFPANEEGYRIGSRFLRQWGRYDEADAITQVARQCFPGQAWPEAEAQASRLARENRGQASRLLAALQGRGAAIGDAAAPGPAPRRVIVILGMHRAGTSLCTQIVRKLGAALGGPLAKPSFDNPDGFFEHTEITACHERLLAALGATWDSVSLVAPLPETFWHGAAVAGVKQRLSRIVEAEIAAGGGVWAFKDPRTARFLPLWRQVFAELGMQPVWLLSVRDPGAVAASLRARDGLPAALGGLLWLEHYLTVLRQLGPEIASIVHYEHWFTAPLAQLGGVAALLGYVEEAACTAALAAIKPGLRHAEAVETLDLARRVHGWLTSKHPDLAQLQIAANATWRELEILAREIMTG